MITPPSRSNNGNTVYFKALSDIKSATDFEHANNVQLAIKAYNEAILKCNFAIQRGLSSDNLYGAKQLIQRAQQRVYELQSGQSPEEAPQQSVYMSSNPPNSNLPNSNRRLYQNSVVCPPSSKPTSFTNNRPNSSLFNNNNNSEQMTQISSAIMRERPDIKFNDVAGLEAAKQALNEAVIVPLKLPEMFTGPTQPWKGILLYGPPGTGKSYLAKAVAGEATNTAFLTVSTSDLTSKWVGESEKLIKSLFETARRSKPAVIFIDEIDSLVSERSGNNESESGRRMKTEFLVQMDGVSANNNGVLLIAATNLPWDLDPAIRRRFERRIYIPLPEINARESLIKNKLQGALHDLSLPQIRQVAASTDGFSGADISIVVRDALMQPIREFMQAEYFLQKRAVDMKGVERDGLWVACAKGTVGSRKCCYEQLPKDELARPVATFDHFKQSLRKVRPSVPKSLLAKYDNWTKELGERGI